MKVLPCEATHGSAEIEDYYDRPRVEIVDIAEAAGMSGMVVDGGCAAGFVGGELLRRGVAGEVVGVEAAADAALRARSRLSSVIEADLGDPTTAALLPAQFDGLILADVLEHIAEPAPLLASLVSRLTPNGVCVVSVPNVRYYRVVFDLVVRNDWAYRPSGVCDTTHLRFFTSRSAMRMCTDAGLKVSQLHGTVGGRALKVARLVAPLTTFLAMQIVIVARKNDSDGAHLPRVGPE
jgi:2-polyprenyl-3-methyl-5-hydroxy-6-metoxy-1,4-benzoquinol methylase